MPNDKTSIALTVTQKKKIDEEVVPTLGKYGDSMGDILCKLIDEWKKLRKEKGEGL